MIKVTENYYVQVDKDCCTIYEKTFNEKKQEDEYKPVCYPFDLVSAVQKIMMYSFAEVTNKRGMSLIEALEVLKELKKEYQNILEEIRKVGEVK